MTAHRTIWSRTSWILAPSRRRDTFCCCSYSTTTRLSFSREENKSIVVVGGTLPVGGKGVLVGQYASVDRTFTSADVQAYASLIGDMNPLHQTWNSNTDNLPTEIQGHPLIRFDKETGEMYGELVHGMLVASLFSCIFGTLTPGAVYLNQSLKFCQPVYTDTPVTGISTITKIRDWNGRRRGGRRGVVLTCQTQVLSTPGSHISEQKDDAMTEYITGEANVWLPRGYIAIQTRKT